MTLNHFLLRHTGAFKALLALLWALVVGGAVLGWRAPRINPAGAFIVLMGLTVMLSLWARWQRERVICEGALPQFLKRKLRDSYSALSSKDAELVERGLRQFFLACHRSKRQFVAMPSKAVDAMWHEFILHTAAYQS